MIFKAQIPSLSFTKWLWVSKENRLLLITLPGIMATTFIYFKSLYPFPNFFPDSLEYLRSAIENKWIDYRPIGYTKFLQLFRAITSSHLLLVLFQYLFLQISQLYLLFTIKYILRPGKWTFVIMVMICILNPLIPHLSNFISSDPLFTALSLIWITQLIWVIAKPGLPVLLIHSIVLLLAFSVRYQALYYPFISIAVILFSRASITTKWISLSFIVVLLGAFIGFTRHQFKKETGIAQFAPFSGWQSIAHALVAYSHSEPDLITAVPVKFRKLHSIINSYMDSLHKTPHVPEIELAPYYMWNEKSPIFRYLGNDTKRFQHHPEFIRWSTIAPFYSEYGNWLSRRHVTSYIKHNITYNILSYNKPPTDYLGMYFTKGVFTHPITRHWFQFEPNLRNHYERISRITITNFFSKYNGILSLLLILCFGGFIFISGFKKSTSVSKKILFWMLFTWICNLGFSILASPIVLRYLSFQIILTFIIEVLLLEFIVLEYKHMSTQQKVIINKTSVAA